ncbi:MAG: hypothetical protein K9K79_13050, partial [Desulfohalobiaceae bacterium]|nr:hypothetical protein [Desulfohalobiaceae bacterium]
MTSLLPLSQTIVNQEFSLRDQSHQNLKNKANTVDLAKVEKLKMRIPDQRQNRLPTPDDYARIELQDPSADACSNGQFCEGELYVRGKRLS